MREFSIVPILETKPAMVAHYFCKGEHCRAVEEEATPSPIIGFPTTGIFIKRDSFGRHVIDNTTVTFFNPGQPFEVDHPVCLPDHSWFISLDDPVFADAWRQFGAAEDYLEGRPFKHSASPLSPNDWVKAANFYKAIKDRSDALALQENIFMLLEWILPLGLNGRALEKIILERKAKRVATAQIYLAEHFRENVQLSDLVEVTETSPFHLCRIFKEQTGHSLHKQLTRLRLRSSLEKLNDPNISITEISHEMGFNSHSHFTTCFQKNFAVTPSVYRAKFS